MNNSIADSIARNPARALEWPLWLTQFILGFFILTPWYTPAPMGRGSNASVVANIAGSDTAVYIYGGILIVIGILGLIGLVLNSPLSQKCRRIAAFSCFLLFLYFVVLRLIVFGPTNLLWGTYFLNCCMAGVIYLRLKWENG